MAAGDSSTSTHGARAHNKSKNIKGVNMARGGKKAVTINVSKPEGPVKKLSLDSLKSDAKDFTLI